MRDKYQNYAVMIIVGWVIYYYWQKFSVINAKFSKIKKALKVFASRDQLWDENVLKKVAKETFNAYCNATDSFNHKDFDSNGPRFQESKIKHLLHPEVTMEVRMGTTDRFSFNSILVQAKCQISINIIHARNSSIDNRDCFTACFDVLSASIVDPRSALDVVFHDTFKSIPHRTSLSDIRTKADHAKEFWTFQRHENKWLLRSIHDEHSWEMFTNMRILDEGKLSNKKD